MFILLAIPHIIASAYINYARGGSKDWLKWPSVVPARPLTGFIYALPILTISPGAIDMPPGLPEVMLQASLVAKLTALYLLMALSTLATQWLGHGSHMDAGTHKDKKDNELLRFPLKPLTWFGVRDGSPGYDFCGLLLKGSIMGLVPMVLAAYFIESWMAGAALMAGFASMPIWYFVNNNWTEIHRERLAGARVYWAELFHGGAIAVGYWGCVVLG